MAVTAGALSIVSVQKDSASLLSAAATAGSGPYTYQWYMSTTTGFTPGVGNLVSGATALAEDFDGLQAASTYYFKVIATDTGDSNLTSTSDQLTVVTNAAGQSPNQFSQSSLLGMVDLYNGTNNITSAQIDASESGELIAGQPVKLVDSAGGVPKVVAASAENDVIWGYIVYNVRNSVFVAGDAVEVAQDGVCMYLQACTQIDRGDEVTLSIVSVGGVNELVGSSGDTIVGYAFDQAPSPAYLLRVILNCPSREVA